MAWNDGMDLYPADVFDPPETLDLQCGACGQWTSVAWHSDRPETCPRCGDWLDRGEEP